MRLPDGTGTTTGWDSGMAAGTLAAADRVADERVSGCRSTIHSGIPAVARKNIVASGILSQNQLICYRLQKIHAGEPFAGVISLEWTGRF